MAENSIGTGYCSKRSPDWSTFVITDEIALEIVEACSISAAEIETRNHRPGLQVVVVRLFYWPSSRADKLAGARPKEVEFAATPIHLYIPMSGETVDIQCRMFANVACLRPSSSTGGPGNWQHQRRLNRPRAAPTVASIAPSETDRTRRRYGRASMLQALMKKEGGRL
jgi:hypothetical protein